MSDAAIHQSVLDGIKLAGAKRILCPHGDVEAFDRALRLNRARYRAHPDRRGGTLQHGRRRR